MEMFRSTRLAMKRNTYFERNRIGIKCGGSLPSARNLLGFLIFSLAGLWRVGGIDVELRELVIWEGYGFILEIVETGAQGINGW